MPLSREQFARHLDQGVAAVRRNIARSCWNELPSGDRYFILLNSSFDGNPLAPGEHIFPDHDVPQTDSRVARSADEVVERLWRDGKIPEWIDITPYEVRDGFLYSELRCCGRFTDDEGHLYHKREGYPPFHIFGPIWPVGYRDLEQDGKFDLHCYRDRKKSTYHALQRTRPSRHGCNPRVPRAGSLSLGLGDLTRMDTTATTPTETATPKPRGIFGFVFLALLLVGNLVVLAGAWQDKSWGALWMAIIGGPVLNSVFLISGLVAIPSLRRRRVQFSLGRHLALTLGVPVAAVVGDFFIIMSMGLHGC